MEEVFAALAIVLSEDQSVLILKRMDEDRSYPKKWCFPGGKIDGDETAEEAVLSELYEETGIEESDIKSVKAVKVVSSVLQRRARIYKIHIFKIEVRKIKKVVLSSEHTDYLFELPATILRSPGNLAGPMTIKMLEELVSEGN